MGPQGPQGGPLAIPGASWAVQLSRDEFSAQTVGCLPGSSQVRCFRGHSVDCSNRQYSLFRQPQCAVVASQQPQCPNVCLDHNYHSTVWNSSARHGTGPHRAQQGPEGPRGPKVPKKGPRVPPETQASLGKRFRVFLETSVFQFFRPVSFWGKT